MSHAPIGAIAKIVAKDLAGQGYDAHTHEGCAAENSSRHIASEIVDNPESVRADAIEICRGDITEQEYEAVSRYYQQYLGESDHYRGVEREAHCMDGDGEHPGIARMKLAHKDHLAQEILLNYRPDTVFDAQAAYQQGTPYYNLDMWAVPLLAEKASLAFPANPDRVLAAAAIRHAAIAHLLPNSQSVTGFGVGLRAVS